MRSLVRALGRVLSRVAANWVPDPFAIAIALTFLTLLVAWVATGMGDPTELIGYWGGRLKGDELLSGEKGFWKLLTFGMQMCLILVTGHALASSGPVRRLIDRVASKPRSQAQALTLTAVVAMSTALVNWGLGLIVGALMAREVGLSARRRGVRVHYPLLGAAGYTGLMVWHGGLSGSAPLTVTQTKDLGSVLGLADLAPITLGDTLLSPLNITVTLLLLVTVPLLLSLMAPDDDDIVEVDPERVGHREPAEVIASPTPAQRLERSTLLAWAAAALGFTYLAMYLARIGVDRIDLNAINLAFLSLGLVLHASPHAYAEAIGDAAKSCSGIILQFPFYAGIMGIMALSGLVEEAARLIASTATESTFAPLTMLAAGVVNLFVPSGGGQWAIQGPLVIQAADALAIAPGKAVMAFAYGDEWTNMLQPFWALPLLGITGLAARDLIGYTGALMLLALPVYLGCLAVF